MTAKIPAALTLVRGQRKDRQNHNEPVSGELVKPAWLEGDLSAAWDELVAEIAPGVLSASDATELAALAGQRVANRKALVDLEENGASITFPVRELANGTVIFGTGKNPAWQVAKESTALIVSLGAKFGLSPVDRQNVKVADDGSKPQGERLLS